MYDGLYRGLNDSITVLCNHIGYGIFYTHMYTISMLLSSLLKIHIFS